MTLGEAIRLIRTKHGETQQQMADALDLCNVYVCELEKDRKLPSLDLLARFRLCYGLDPYVIMALSDWKINVTKHMLWLEQAQKD